MTKSNSFVDTSNSFVGFSKWVRNKQYFAISQPLVSYYGKYIVLYNIWYAIITMNPYSVRYLCSNCEACYAHLLYIRK